jgi:hypothetical protein
LKRSREKAAKLADIEDWLRIKTLEAGGATNKEVLEWLYLESSPEDISKKRLTVRRWLETLRKDPDSDVIAKQQGREFDSDEELPGKGNTHEIVWAVRPGLVSMRPDLEAITIITATKFAGLFLPKTQQEWLESRYANLYPTTLGNSEHKKWENKIQIESRYPPIYPKLGEDYDDKEEIIFEALQANNEFSASYDFDTDHINSYFPVRLLRREHTLYILCALNGRTDEFESFAIHRFTNVKPSDTKPNKWRRLTKKYIDQVTKTSVDSKKWKVYDRISIRVSGESAHHFTAARFHEDVLKENLTEVSDFKYKEGGDEQDNKIEALTLTIRDIQYSYEIRTWILGLGAKAEVLKPTAIRDDIASEISALSEMYSGVPRVC